jgi:hypothetical protein
MAKKATTRKAAARTTAKKAAPRTDELTAVAEDPNATPRARRDALQAQFDKADEEGKASMIEEARLRNAAMGSGF